MSGVNRHSHLQPYFFGQRSNLRTFWICFFLLWKSVTTISRSCWIYTSFGVNSPLEELGVRFVPLILSVILEGVTRSVESPVVSGFDCSVYICLIYYENVHQVALLLLQFIIHCKHTAEKGLSSIDLFPSLFFSLCFFLHLLLFLLVPLVLALHISLMVLWTLLCPCCNPFKAIKCCPSMLVGGDRVFMSYRVDSFVVH